MQTYVLIRQLTLAGDVVLAGQTVTPFEQDDRELYVTLQTMRGKSICLPFTPDPKFYKPYEAPEIKVYTISEYDDTFNGAKASIVIETNLHPSQVLEVEELRKQIMDRKYTENDLMRLLTDTLNFPFDRAEEILSEFITGKKADIAA